MWAWTLGPVVSVFLDEWNNGAYMDFPLRPYVRHVGANACCLRAGSLRYWIAHLLVAWGVPVEGGWVDPVLVAVSERYLRNLQRPAFAIYAVALDESESEAALESLACHFPLDMMAHRSEGTTVVFAASDA